MAELKFLKVFMLKRQVPQKSSLFFIFAIF